ncbi:O-antigen polysaccharide polymerase Wzy [Tolypothrix sp. PCC 7910]|uniref:O-antigen polysaccharide polymerase Wzy n=1 Tax=Tolypothrix sp. PCC 7910 TaxID=2099387 RepID=UPI0014278123|nr:O-antigen polysaccharide polymerase Wzy [Tolypothrix sp. PCC 7910]QIR40484.1 O-antigen polysaccharide polymerase Wzy [Tolypothrix sp. PCC 7910]
MHNYYNQNTQNQYLIASIRAKREQETYLKRICFLLIFGLVVGSFYLWNHRPVSLSTDKGFLALGILWIGFFPSIQYLLDRNRPPMPFLPLMGVFYVNSFAVPIFSSEKLGIGRWSQASVSIQSLQLTLIGLIGMVGVFYATKLTIWKQISPIKLPSYSLNKLINPIQTIVVLHIVFSYFIKLPSVDQLSNVMGNIGYGIFYIIWSRNKNLSLKNKLIVGSCFLFDLLIRFVGGSLANVGFIGTFMGIVIFYERKRIPIVLISILLVFFMTFNIVKGEYRQLTWFGGPYANASPIEKAQLFIDIAVKYYSNPNLNSKEDKESASASAMSRTAHIILFSNIIADTPQPIPYWSGGSYLGFFSKFIPRALWPDKPSEGIGNEFGRRYRYIGKKDYSTTFNLPLIAEMYANFGAQGVQIGMALLGALFSLFEQKLNSPKMGSVEIVIGIGILYSFTSHEWNFSLMFGNVFTVSLVIYLIFRFILRQQQAQKNVV